MAPPAAGSSGEDEKKLMERAAESTKLPLSQIKEFWEAFKVFDKDNSGSVTTVELGHILRSLGQQPTEKDVAEMIAQVDKNNDGTMDFEEFALMLASKLSSPGADPEQELRDAFAVFDKNGDGFISHSELKQVMQNLGEQMSPEDLDEMIREADKNHDGQVDYNEFLEMMKISH